MTSPFDGLSPRAAWFMENFDVFGLAEICASGDAGQAALVRARALAAEWASTGAQLGAVINMGEAADALLAALEPPKEIP